MHMYKSHHYKQHFLPFTPQSHRNFVQNTPLFPCTEHLTSGFGDDDSCCIPQR